MLGKAIYAGLLAVQQGLKAPKDKNGGKYKYRSAEDILEKVKPLLQEQGLILLMDEEINADAVGSFIMSTVTLIDIASGDSLTTKSPAREDVGTKFMSPGQATGAAVSYSRKYALCGMFAIDNEEDLDSPTYQQARKPSQKSQEARGEAKTPQPSQDTKAQDTIRKQALHALSERMKELGVLKEEVQALAGVYYNKLTTAEMSTNEICDLANNLKKYIDEQTGARDAG